MLNYKISSNSRDKIYPEFFPCGILGTLLLARERERLRLSVTSVPSAANTVKIAVSWYFCWFMFTSWTYSDWTRIGSFLKNKFSFKPIKEAQIWSDIAWAATHKRNWVIFNLHAEFPVFYFFIYFFEGLTQTFHVAFPKFLLCGSKYLNTSF